MMIMILFLPARPLILSCSDAATAYSIYSLKSGNTGIAASLAKEVM